MGEIEVPPYFLCPISLEIMRDPVTATTGITYDRASIEKWLFSEKNMTCPVTKQTLSSDADLTPNITLRRLIQSWCTLNASHGVERFPTPRPPVSKVQLSKLLNAADSPKSLLNCLATLKSLASENETNKRCIEAAGAVEFLVSIIRKGYRLPSSASISSELGLGSDEGFEWSRASDQALGILYSLRLSETGLRSLLAGDNGEFLETLTHVMRRGSCESRAYAVLLLNSIFEEDNTTHGAINLRPRFFAEVVRVLDDRILYKATKAALQVLCSTCSQQGRNKIKAVEAGAVRVAIDLMLEHTEKRACELLMKVVEQLCQCAEGRAELLGHGAGLAIVSKKIMRVSRASSESAVRILHSVSKYSATQGFLQEMLQLGVVSKLCLVIQVDCDGKTKEKAREVLKMHTRAWKNSPCMPTNIVIHSYPSCH